MVTEIIDSLASNEGLTSPLLRTLAFSRRIGNEELATWVLKELNGYKRDDELPDYRYTRTVVLSVMKQNGMLTREVSLPISCFSEGYQKILMKKSFNESVAMLEDISKSKNNYISKEFAADLCQALTQDANKNGCNFRVVSCRQLVAIPEIITITTSIRTKLMELLLVVEKDYPKIEELKNDKEFNSKVNATITYLVGNIYNIQNSGEGSVLNTGDGNSVNVNNAT